MRLRLLLLLVTGSLLATAGCVNESPTVVVFDQELESVTFENKLFSPIRVFRDGSPLDTVPARSTKRYPINRKGIVRHSWSLMAPTDNTGRRLGVEPYIDLGIQYDIDAWHTITYKSPGREIFTPRVGNSTADNVKLFYVNYRESDEFLVNLEIPAGHFVNLQHAPYYYWNSESNVYVQNLDRPATYRFNRDDTTAFGDPELDLSDSPEYDDAGVTIPLIVD
jgi:hypothetical protein